jgi:hypothetical protein
MRGHWLGGEWQPVLRQDRCRPDELGILLKSKDKPAMAFEHAFFTSLLLRRHVGTK